MKLKLLSILVVSSILLSSCSFTSSKSVTTTTDKVPATEKPQTPSKPSDESNDPSSDKNKNTNNPGSNNNGNTSTNDPNPNNNGGSGDNSGSQTEPKNIVIDPNLDVSKLSTTKKSWYYIPRTDGTPSGEPKDIVDLVKKYYGYYLGDTSSKVIYLTFDEGYENGYTSKILDVLKANDVKAAFFVTTPYINSDKDLVKRMVAEGHIVGNHSTTHPSMPLITDKTKFDKEINTCESTFENLTGTKMPRFFRPPMGEYSELSLYYTASLGYRSIFWSFAYNDWDPNNQPSLDYAKKLILERTHNGGIFLLHAVSKTNSEILDSLIKEWKSRGFTFKTLNSLT